MAKKKSGGDKKGKKEVKNKVAAKVWTKYTVEGETLKRKKSCPKCGVGVFLGEHKNRLACGKCGYTEMISK